MNTDNVPDGMSTNEYLATLPLQRRSHEASGRLLLLPRLGLVVVPYARHGNGWDAVVAAGTSMYPRGGHDLFVSALEIETAVELVDHDGLLALAGPASAQPAAHRSHESDTKEEGQ